jgi:hypothetical protein
MASLLVPSRERRNKMHTPVWVYNFSDETYSDSFDGETYRILPRSKMLVSAYIAWQWVGDPDLRKNAELWHKEVNRLKFRNGSGTTEFEKWLLGKKLVVEGFGNHEDGYYGIVPNKTRTVHTSSVGLSEAEQAGPSGLSQLSTSQSISEEDVFKFFEGMVSKEANATPQGSGKSEDFDEAIEFSTGTINLA